MSSKVWLQDRWKMLLPILAELTVDQEEEIARVCQEEIAYWRSRETMQSLSSLNTPMTFMRKKIKEIDLTEKNSYINPRSGQREHIALKYPNMNFSPEEWRAISAPSVALQQRRMEAQKTIENPEAVVTKGAELLKSSYWPDRAVAIALGLGLRLSEIFSPITKLSPHTLYSVDFFGQMKQRDKVLLPYERPTLMKSEDIIEAWRWLRGQVEWEGLEPDAINDRYGQKVIDAANRHFSTLVPPREDKDLYTHLFRAVYGTIAIFYYCPEHVHSLTYLNAILGHSWVSEDGTTERDYKATLYYDDYRVSDAAVFRYQGKRQGVLLDQPGVEILGVFKPKEEASASTSRKGKGKKVGLLQTEKPKDHSIIRANAPTVGRVTTVHDEEGHNTYDETVSLLVDEHYMVKQLTSLLSPLYEQLEVNTPLRAVDALLGDGGAYQIDQRLSESYQTSLAELVALLDEANADKGDKTPAAYLRELVEAKRTFKKSYEKRHVGKDYSTLATSALRKTKMPGAAEERFKRAVDTIMKHNDTVTIPEFRRYVSPALVIDLVGGRPSEAKTYIESRADVPPHHEKYGIKPGINRIPLMSVKLEVPEWPEGVTPSEVSEQEDVPEEETTEVEEGVTEEKETSETE